LPTLTCTAEEWPPICSSCRISQYIGKYLQNSEVFKNFDSDHHK